MVSAFRAIAAVMLSGLGLMMSGRLWIGCIFLILAIAGATILGAKGRLSGGLTQSDGMLAMVQLSLVCVEVARLHLAAQAIGAFVSLGAVLAMSASGVAGAVIGVVPAGLGVREAAATGLGVLAQLDAATALVAATLNRLAGMAVLLPLAGVVLTVSGVRSKTMPADC